MFWKKKKKKKSNRDKALEQAKNMAAAKREEIGDETLEKIREAITKKDNSAMGRARAEIMGADKDKVVDNLSLLLRDKE